MSAFGHGIVELGLATRGNSGGTRWADVQHIVCHNLDRCCDQSRCFVCIMDSQQQPHEVEPPTAANGLELAELRPACDACVDLRTNWQSRVKSLQESTPRARF